MSQLVMPNGCYIFFFGRLMSPQVIHGKTFALEINALHRDESLPAVVLTTTQEQQQRVPSN